MVVAVDPSRQNPSPDGMYTCGNFEWTLADFREKLQFDPQHPQSESSEPEYCNCLRQSELAAVIVVCIVGFVLLVVVPILCCSVLCFLHCRRHRKQNWRGTIMGTVTNNTEEDSRYSPLHEEK